MFNAALRIKFILKTVYTIAEGAFSFSPVFFEADGLPDSKLFSDPVRPDEGEREEIEQSRQAFLLGHMSSFKVKASGFQTREERFNRLALGVGYTSL
jgi:hypothetical protein